ncbi:unnamed protein product [Echinostoma caproni]|uniref:Lipopolysaccharide choline phosphotransferase protein n=1 Tax=Echinostoma caproni TaxID=27848 RepID=A0A183AXP8_9TREM|nr:unnamed protein product [Echinostoma caproni]
MICENWQQLLYATKITLTVCTALLLGVGLEEFTELGANYELISIGSFEHPESIARQYGIQMKDYPLLLALDPFLVKPRKNATEHKMLPNLTALHWPPKVVASRPAGSVYENGTTAPLPRPFEPIMSNGQINLSRRLLKLFSDLMFEHGYGDRFWLNGGSLVGSYHHHNFIPWDDDVDVLADVELRPEIQRLLKTLEPEYKTYSMYVRDKLFSETINQSQAHLDLEYSRATSNNPWSWPFLDIGYCRIEPVKTCEDPWIPGLSVCYPTSSIFPLIYRPFGDDWYPSPSNVPVYLRSMYREHTSCVTFGYSHILESGSRFGRVPCHTLLHRYPFVRHLTLPGSQVVARNNSIAQLFTVDMEQLSKRSDYKWDMIHTLRLPIQRENVVQCIGYGVPEPR